MDGAPDLSALSAGGARNRVQIGCVGAGTLGLGLFLASLHALAIDPSTRSMGLAMVLLLYGVALLFVAVGALMLGVAVFRSGRDVAALEGLLVASPQEVVSARRMVANRYGITAATGESTLGQHQAHVTSASGRTWVINASAGQVSAILDLVQRCNPDADIDGR